ncbi:hypothetical protein PPERSA_03211 [Pseudocohnilembus persalinus]|uniref:Transmembrane protein n=1 Tax=Pseudocohnilembus persalinus TaxID=266149 RepID=A0A0V0QE37_PSEPJ|nr:hypothetical protein PPERSA_03211 [Pseudocohnilembus persalinus]|eukprot:KRX00478.1 hypothetical protein PPERSA_03211 [Pseudocohnilembus persalinus]
MKKKIEQFYHIGTIIGSIVFHFMDLVTDFLLMETIYGIIIKYPELNFQFNLYVLIIAIVLERIASFINVKGLLYNEENKMEQQFEEKTKIFISNCMRLPFLKICDPNIHKYHDLYTNEYHRLKKKYGSKFSEIKIMLDTKIPFLAHLYIAIISLAYVLGVGVFLCLQSFSTKVVYTFDIIKYSVYLFLPYVFLYMAIYLKSDAMNWQKIQNDIILNNKNKLRHTLVFIINLPLSCLMGFIQIVLPIRSGRIPFLNRLSENWILNFYSSAYIMIIRVVYVTYFYIGCREIMVYKRNFNPTRIKSQQSIDNLTHDGSYVLYMFYIAEADRFQKQQQQGFLSNLQLNSTNLESERLKLKQSTPQTSPKRKQKDQYQKQCKNVLDSNQVFTLNQICQENMQNDQNDNNIDINEKKSQSIDISFDMIMASSYRERKNYKEIYQENYNGNDFDKKMQNEQKLQTKQQEFQVQQEISLTLT